MVMAESESNHMHQLHLTNDEWVLLGGLARTSTMSPESANWRVSNRADADLT
jgi:hypothetical protein